MDRLSRKDRLRIESYRRIGEDVVLGKVEVASDKCTGCGFCTRACPARALEVVDRKATMAGELALCVACGDCVAICPENAIKVTGYIKFRRHFRYLDRGDPTPPRRF